MSRLFNPLPADDRSTEEQLRDLGVEVIRPKAKPTPKVTGVKWAQRRKVTRRIKRRQQKPRITFCKYHLYFSVSATKILNPAGKSFEIGTCIMDGRKALILREDKKGYKITVAKKKGCEFGQNGAPGLLNQLANAGLERGRYELVAAKGYDGVWLGVPVEGAAK
jgi:hypothetical protein